MTPYFPQSLLIHILEPGSQTPDILHAELKKWINVIIQNKEMNCLESVQAMLIAACYSAERSLILSFATRMALDLNLDAAFENLTQRLVMKETAEAYNCCCPETITEEERSLVRESRTWFGLLVLEHMYVSSSVTMVVCVLTCFLDIVLMEGNHLGFD